MDSLDPAAVLFRSLLDYGLTSDENVVDSLSELYQRSMALVDTPTRLRMLVELSALAGQRKLSANALLPFVFRDTDPAVISSAALSTASLWPSSENDPLLGVRELAGFAHQYAEDGDEPRAAAILSGLLLLGDRRITTLLQNCWRWLSEEGRVALSHMDSGVLHAPLIDWFIDWLADCEQGDFGAVAAALTRISQRARGQQVLEVERVLPTWLAVEGQPIRLIQEWTFDDFGERIRARLEEIARLESEPKLVPAILEAWQLGVYRAPSGWRGLAPDLPTGERPRDLLVKVQSTALERSAGVKPFTVFEQELLAAGGDLILCWGIFNPYGPTLSCFGRLRTARPDVSLLFYRMLNPFRQDTFVLGTLVGADRIDGTAIARMLQGAFRDNWIATLGTEPIYLIGNGAPTLIVCPWNDPAFEGAISPLFKDSPAIRGCGLAETVDYMQQHPLHPWERTAEQRDKAFAEFIAMKKGNEPPKLAQLGPPSSQETVEAWYRMVTAHDHTMVELACFPDAWNGAIEHSASPELQASAYPMQRLNAFLAAFEYPIFEEIAQVLRERRE